MISVLVGVFRFEPVDATISGGANTSIDAAAAAGADGVFNDLDRLRARHRWQA